MTEQITLQEITAKHILISNINKLLSMYTLYCFGARDETMKSEIIDKVLFCLMILRENDTKLMIDCNKKVNNIINDINKIDDINNEI